MSRHTTFRYCLDPTVEQLNSLVRHAGAARFAFNQCLQLHLLARRAHKRQAAVPVPWTGFDLINVFNAWKKTVHAGRVITVRPGAESMDGLPTSQTRWTPGGASPIQAERPLPAFVPAAQ
ncbi:helix-turn-helix domain-containing protein [Nocardia salmonicida]|uniref:helix-turn-helix domain-containing protein n=1 Tax=Nocardia salmonicida TaxID=53431 RepID=UPI003CECED50